MHIPTHLLAGWCGANCVKLTPRERLFGMLAATLSDLDGVGIVFGPDSDAYQNTHHVLGHNVFFGVLLSAGLASCSTHRAKAFIVYLVLFHTHLLMDFFGSGPLWKIYYLWPLDRDGAYSRHAWELTSWQNYTAFAVLLAWTIALAVKKRRTPLEVIAPRLDRALVGQSEIDAHG